MEDVYETVAADFPALDAQIEEILKQQTEYNVLLERLTAFNAHDVVVTGAHHSA